MDETPEAGSSARVLAFVKNASKVVKVAFGIITFVGAIAKIGSDPAGALSDMADVFNSHGDGPDIGV